jgi:hypothetical protein
MGRLRRKVLGFSLTGVSLVAISACGGHRPPGISPFPAKITLSPGPATSLQLGSFQIFTATAQNSSGGNVSASFTFTSSNTTILNIAPGGVACAGVWNQNYTVCTPGAAGEVEVTATALGATSAPTLVFVHPPIDNIAVTGIIYNGIVPQEPCLSQGETMTVEAHAFSQGIDITSAVGSFTWSANNSNVVKITPIVTNVVFNGFTYNIGLNQATVAAVTPGLTQIYATANGASSGSASSGTFQQPVPYTYQGSPIYLDFFETCNIQNITVEINPNGIEQSGQTTFTASKGAAQNAIATVTDIFGNSSLPNTNGNVVLTKIPLTWSASQPTAVAPGTGCTLSCSIATPSVGSGTVTAACSPPTCNIGFPFIPASLSTNGQLDLNKIAACSQAFGISCGQVIPYPVYASLPAPPPTPQTGGSALSGLVTGTTGSATVLAGSLGCYATPPQTCTTGIYSLATGRTTPGTVNLMPVAANSLLFDLGGDKAYIGSQFGAQLVNPTNFGTANGAFTSLGTVNGQVLGISNSGTLSVFSDTVHTPNQVYVVNSASSNSLSATALNINLAVGAAFSPDGLKAFVLGDQGDSLYIYSQLQALQGPGLEGAGTNPQLALSGRASIVDMSPNGAFAFVPESSLNGSAPNLTVFNVCDNSIATSSTGVPAVVTLPANPLFAQVLPAAHIDGTDSLGNSIPDGIHILILDSTGFDVITASNSLPTNGSLCPQNLAFVPTTLANGTTTDVQRVELGLGTIEPVNFFSSADGSLLYVLTNSSSRVFVYDFETRSVSGIPLQGSAVPIAAAMTVDAGTIVAATNDGLLHEISTALGGNDLYQVPFPNLPDYLNPFCTFSPSQVPCALNLIAVKP